MEVTENILRKARRLNQDLSRLGMHVLSSSDFKTENKSARYTVLQYFTQSQAHFDGSIRLMTYRKGMARTASLQLRVLFEIWLNVNLVTEQDKEAWSNYLAKVSYKQFIKDAKQLQLENASDIRTNYKKLIKELEPEIDFNVFNNLINLTNKENQPRDFYDATPLNLREKAIIIDYLKPNNYTTKFKEVYNIIYKITSVIAHAEIYSNEALFYPKNGLVNPSINGNITDAYQNMKFCFLFYASTLQILCKSYGINIEHNDLLLEKRFNAIYKI